VSVLQWDGKNGDVSDYRAYLEPLMHRLRRDLEDKSPSNRGKREIV
jgi:hypothetical protein